MADTDMQTPGTAAATENSSMTSRMPPSSSLDEAQAKLAQVDMLMRQIGMDEQSKHLRYEVASLSKSTTMSFAAWPAVGGAGAAAASWFAAGKTQANAVLKAVAAAVGGIIGAVVAGKVAPKAGKMQKLAGQMDALADKYAQRIEEHIGHMAEQMNAQQGAMPAMPPSQSPDMTGPVPAQGAPTQQPGAIEQGAVPPQQKDEHKPQDPQHPQKTEHAQGPHHHVPGDMAPGEMASKYASQGSASYTQRAGGQRAGEEGHVERAIERQKDADRVGAAPVR